MINYSLNSPNLKIDVAAIFSNIDPLGKYIKTLSENSDKKVSYQQQDKLCEENNLTLKELFDNRRYYVLYQDVIDRNINSINNTDDLEEIKKILKRISYILEKFNIILK